MATERELSEFARQLRRNPTEWEIRLWRHLSNSQLGGYKFRRQAKFAPYIVDFFCPSKGLIIELDGDTHSPESDEARDIYFLRSGFTTLRFSNAEVRENLEGVLQTILAKLSSLPDRWPGFATTPPPQPLP
ncbi:endonuclease domain-containing protein [Sphingomonas sp.]|uniref:endonuclease domain-containing protein n=1 Tax=Sphingomonas sp. TaxID=28214 RepID=UPI002ED9B6D4